MNGKKIRNELQVYSEEMLEECKNGKPCDYGICDECPNIIGFYRSDEDEED